MLGTDITIRSARFRTSRFAYRSPIKFGGRVVTDVTVFDVAVDVETPLGRQATGWGSMTMGNAWAWPSAQLSSEQTLAAVIELAQRLTKASEGLSGHPFEICHQLSTTHTSHRAAVESSQQLSETMPPLAVLLAGCAVEAAVFDAYGRAARTSSYRLLGKEHLKADLGDLVDPQFKGLRLDQFIAPEPQAMMPLYHLVGALDPLDWDEVNDLVGDGLPETLGEWILRDGLTHLKLKLAGDDLAWDLARVIKVNRIASETAGDRNWKYSLDFNERCPHAAYVLELLDSLQREAPSALARIQYIEQPTHRDLKRHPENVMHSVAERMPVVIDESLVDFESLVLARQQGYSGVALKACKGHAEALLMAAVARHWNMFLCVQDLTCIGPNLLHSASLAAHIPTVAAIESNGRQYCPMGNRAWEGEYRPMFQIHAGRVPTALLNGQGLGFDWPVDCRF